MTVEEAKALVLREGLAGDNTSEDAVFIRLHFGDEPEQERMRCLLEALRIICDGLQGEAFIDRSLAAALWTLGNSSNECLLAHDQYRRPWRDGAMDEVCELILTIEGIFYGIPFEGMKITTG